MTPFGMTRDARRPEYRRIRPPAWPREIGTRSPPGTSPLPRKQRPRRTTSERPQALPGLQRPRDVASRSDRAQALLLEGLCPKRLEGPASQPPDRIQARQSAAELGAGWIRGHQEGQPLLDQGL